MTRVQRLEREIEELTPSELAAFRKWFQDYDAAQWDKQIERDAATGKFDRLAQRVYGPKGKTPLLSAKLFFRGMILCENVENLKFIKTIDLVQVRRIMKQANPDLFAEFLERIVGG